MRSLARGIVNRSCSCLEIATEEPRPDPRTEVVSVRVQTDGVSSGRHIGSELGPTLHLFAYQEERGQRPHMSEPFQHRGRAPGVWAIIEGERHPACVGDVVKYAKRASKAGDDGG